MSENTTNNKNVRDDEIDLLDLFRRMGKTLKGWFHSIGRGFLISAVFLIRRWFWLTLSVIVGICIAGILKLQTDDIFSSEITLRSNTVPNSDMITYINRLHAFAADRDIAALASALSLSQDDVMHIYDIQAFWAIDLGNDGVPDRVDYKDTYNVRDTINIRMKDRFVVRLRLSGAPEFSIFTEAILGYASKNQLFQQKNQVRLAQKNELRVRLNYDINQLDSLQKVKYFEETRNRTPTSGGQMIFLQEQNTQLIYSDIYTLYTRKQSIDYDLEIYKDVVSLLSDFIPSTRPINGILYYGKVTISVCILLCIIFLILLDSKKKLQEIFRKY